MVEKIKLSPYEVLASNITKKQYTVQSTMYKVHTLYFVPCTLYLVPCTKKRGPQYKIPFSMNIERIDY